MRADAAGDRAPGFLEKVANSFGRTPRPPEAPPARPEPAKREPAMAGGEESTYDIPAFLRFR
jgi:hypothetical protein